MGCRPVRAAPGGRGRDPAAARPSLLLARLQVSGPTRWDVGFRFVCLDSYRTNEMNWEGSGGLSDPAGNGLGSRRGTDCPPWCPRQPAYLVGRWRGFKHPKRRAYGCAAQGLEENSHGDSCDTNVSRRTAAMCASEREEVLAGRGARP